MYTKNLIPGFTGAASLYKSSAYLVTHDCVSTSLHGISPAIAPGLSGVGLKGVGGGLNAWGCWDGCCSAYRCVEYKDLAGPTGLGRYCVRYECPNPCTKCIWPW